MSFNSTHPLLLKTAVLLTAFAGGALTTTKAPAAPVVGGYERLGRAGEVSSAVSGRLLLSELSCTACHPTDQPELNAKRGPSLVGIGMRVSSAWTQQFLESPTATKPGTTMPDVLNAVPASQRRDVSKALAAFLDNQKRSFPEITATATNPVLHEFWKKGDERRGRTLYHEIGCVVCHLPNLDDAESLSPIAEANPPRPIPLGNLADKYSLRSLSHFLLDPLDVRPAGRMPDFGLSPSEAADLTAYLLSSTQPKRRIGSGTSLDDSDVSLIADGQDWFFKLRCHNCHDVGKAGPHRAAKPIHELNVAESSSCWSAERGETARPYYDLDDQQISVLRRALRDTKPAWNAAQRAELQLLQLNCHRCHVRDAKGGVQRDRRAFFSTVGHVDLGDEGRLPPELTGVGRKQTAGWLAKTIAGKTRLRSHMKARMPAFSQATITELPQMLANADELPDAHAERHSRARPLANPSLVATGRQLVDAGCVQCHPIRGKSMPGVVGVDLEGIAERLQLTWFRTFLLDPNSLKPRTRMPTLFAGGKTPYPNVLNGSVDQQIDAIWTYLANVKDASLPQQIVDAHQRDYELRAIDQPVLLRTFMQEAGTHAIAVGFPEGVHYAFDARLMRLAQIWRGRFVDARGTWFDRFAPPAEPLGRAIVSFRRAPDFAILRDEQQPWPAQSAIQQFRGYQFDADRVPVLSYQIGTWLVRDSIRPEKHQLRRRLSIEHIVDANVEKNASSDLFFRAHESRHLAKREAFGRVSANGLHVSVSGQEGIDRSLEGQMEWLIRMPITQERNRITLEVDYSW